MIVPIWINVRYQQRERQDSQNLSDDAFFRLHVTCAQSIIGAEKFPDAGILLKFDDDDGDIQCFETIKEAFGSLTEDDIFQPYISDIDFRSTIENMLERTTMVLVKVFTFLL